MEVLGRHLSLSPSSRDESAERECFLIDRLQLPAQWIAEAKAVRAGAEHNFKDQAWYLIRAGFWNRAHSVVVKKIAPDAIINGDYDFLLTLLTDLAEPGASAEIQEWKNNGGVFFDFITVDLEIKDLLAQRDEETVHYR